MQLRQSMRRAARMRLALAGASGSGKTYSSLLIAYGMTGDWSRVAVIDSENCSADLYAHLGGYQVLTLENIYTFPTKNCKQPTKVWPKPERLKKYT